MIFFFNALSIDWHFFPCVFIWLWIGFVLCAFLISSHNIPKFFSWISWSCISLQYSEAEKKKKKKKEHLQGSYFLYLKDCPDWERKLQSLGVSCYACWSAFWFDLIWFDSSLCTCRKLSDIQQCVSVTGEPERKGASVSISLDQNPSLYSLIAFPQLLLFSLPPSCRK